MEDIYKLNKNNIANALLEVWHYMKLNQKIEKSDLIIGCGCYDLDIPVKCAQLLKKGYAHKILFTGGLGKGTKDIFHKTEAETYRDIAIENGIKPDNIIIENKSTNTGDNFRFSMQILEDKRIRHNKIIIVHKAFNERRTLSAAKAILDTESIVITSPDITFDEYIERLEHMEFNDIMDDISTIVGDIQRLVIYPQLGWQTKETLTKSVEKAYYYLKEIGFSKYLLSKDNIKELINKYGLVNGEEANYFN